jgi:hypothetical protein
MFLFKNNILSQNLIQNGSFESYSVNANGCAFNFPMVNIWQQINSPDHFSSSCTFTNNYGVPNNTFGCSYPKNGNAYVGIACYYKTIEAKEYIYQHLNNPLIANKSYYVSFYISLADMTGYAINNIGANLSAIQPTVISIPYVSANPQIINQNGYITDTVGWTKIEGYFTAQGGEQYITIGNFNSNTNTDTLYQGTTNPLPSDPGMSYYYIDSVSLYDSLDYITNIKTNKYDFKVNLYPNPNNGNFKLEYHITKEAEFVITDITGRLVNQYALLPSQNSLLIKEEELNAGVYFYSIKMNNSLIKNDKLIIIK